MGLLPLGQLCHGKAEGIMEIGAQSMIEVILLQIPPPVREVLWVHSAYYGDCLMYAKHVLLHHLVIPLLDLIQSPYHGIIITKCLFHVHQQVPHGDILALVQRVSPFARVPTEAGEDVRVHAGLIILLEEGIHIEAPECVHHLHPQISRLKDWHIQSGRHQLFPLPTPPVTPAPMLAACSLTCSGVSIRVRCPPVQGGGRQASCTHCSALGFWWPSTWSRSPSTGGEPCLSRLFHPRGSSNLLWCTSHQLAQGVRLPCSYIWHIVGWVLCLTSYPSAVRGSDQVSPYLH